MKEKKKIYISESERENPSSEEKQPKQVEETPFFGVFKGIKEKLDVAFGIFIILALIVAVLYVGKLSLKLSRKNPTTKIADKEKGAQTNEKSEKSAKTKKKKFILFGRDNDELETIAANLAKQLNSLLLLQNSKTTAKIKVAKKRFSKSKKELIILCQYTQQLQDNEIVKNFEVELLKDEKYKRYIGQIPQNAPLIAGEELYYYPEN